MLELLQNCEIGKSKGYVHMDCYKWHQIERIARQAKVDYPDDEELCRKMDRILEMRRRHFVGITHLVSEE